MRDATIGVWGFLDFLGQVLDVFPPGPSEWTKMNGPTVTSAAVVYGFFGLLFVGLGCGLLLGGGPTAMPIAGVISLCVGLAALTNVVMGVARFLKT
jgi:hypothetical protein